MNIKQTLGKATSLLGRTPPEDTESEAEDPDVYHSKAIITNDVFPVCEIEWKHLHRHLRFKADVDSMPYDLIKSRIDFSAFPGPLDFLSLNPSLRVRKGKKTVLIPMTIIKPPTLEIYFLQVKKLSLAHLQRQFQFNLLTAPLINLMPFPIVSAAFLSLNYHIFGSPFYSQQEFLPGLAIAVSVASLLTIMWTHLVQHSERSHDAKRRRLENDLMVTQLEELKKQLRPNSTNSPLAVLPGSMPANDLDSGSPTRSPR